MKVRGLFFLLLILSFFSFINCDFSPVLPIIIQDNSTILDTYEKQKCEWLIIMYVDGDNNLQDSLFSDINEVENALYTYASKNINWEEDIRIVALWDGFSNYENGSKSTKIYEFGPDSTKDLTSLCKNTKNLTSLAYSTNNNWINYNPYTKEAEVNMGDGNTLTNFLKWVDLYYDANHKILQFSNHGAGPRSVVSNRALCTDDTSSTNTNTELLLTKEVALALKNAGYGSQENGTKNQFEMLIFDICFGASIEDAYEFRDYAKYLLGSANEVPGDGLDYTKLLDSFNGKNTDIISFGKSIIDNFKEYYTNHPYYYFVDWYSEIETYGSEEMAKYYSKAPSTFSLFDLSKVEDVATSIDKLSDYILENNDEFPFVVENGNGETIEYLILLKDYLSVFFTIQPTIPPKVYYKGTFTWLHDIGFLAKNLATFCYNEEGNIYEGLSDLHTKATNVTESLKDAIVYTWREGPSFAEEGYFSEDILEEMKINSLYYGSNLPYGMTICGATIASYNEQYIEYYAPTFYKTALSFGKNTSWGTLLEYYFEQEKSNIGE